MKNKILIVKKHFLPENYHLESKCIKLFLDRDGEEPDLSELKSVLSEIGDHVAVEILPLNQECHASVLLMLNDNEQLITVDCQTAETLSAIPDLSESAFLNMVWYDPKYCIKEEGYCYFSDSYEHIYRIHKNVIAQDMLNCFSGEYGHMSINDMLKLPLFNDYIGDNYQSIISDNTKYIELVTPFDAHGYVRQDLIKQEATYSDGSVCLGFDLSEGFNAI